MAGKLTVANIVASASPTAWSQTYHAGGLTAVISLVAPQDIETNEVSLAQIGKGILNNLEAEYFGLAEKDLEGIKHAAVSATKDIDPSLSLSFIVASIVGNILYLVIVGSGKVCVKRSDAIGVILEELKETSQPVASSGYVQHADVIILQTAQFAGVISQDVLAKSIDNNHPEEIAEILAPIIHRSEEGGASAIIFSYQEEIPPSIAEKIADENLNQEVSHGPDSRGIKNQEQKGDVGERGENASTVASSEAMADKEEPDRWEPESPKKPFKIALSHSQRLYLSIAVVLVVILFGSIVFFQKREAQNKDSALFTSIYDPAKEKYNEGEGLLSLNKNLARDDFAQAESLLSGHENAFPQGSSDKKQIDDLKSKVDAAIAALANVNEVQANQVADSSSPLLAFSKTHSGYIAQDDINFYFATSKGITEVNKNSSASKTVVTNSGDWTSLGGFGTYLGNFYVLDQKDGILKYVGGNTKSAYLASGVKPDFTKAASLAIDGSIWVLTSDGNILKFTRGTEDSLTISGLDKSFSSPTQIVTSVNDNNVYVLDNGNSRIVVLKKDGSFVAQYQASILKSATQMDVDETNNKAFVLAGNSIYEIDFK